MRGANRDAMLGERLLQRRRLELEIRTILVTYRDALHGRDGAAADAAKLLDEVAVKIEGEEDPDLRRLLEEARSEIER